MRELSLFTGAGGGVLGSKLLGWTTVGYVEYDKYCQKVLKQRIADGILDAAPIFGDIRSFISEGYAESYRDMVDVVSGGFPCQPFSIAGKQKGEDDERNMWPSTIEVIRRIRPRYCFLENVPNILNHTYFGRILADLAESGYDARWKVISAGELGAIHRRDRLWIVAYCNNARNDTSRIVAHSELCSDSRGREKGRKENGLQKENRQTLCGGMPNRATSGTENSYDWSERRERVREETLSQFTGFSWCKDIRRIEDLRNRPDIPEPLLCRTDNGLADRLERTKAIGNGQVCIVAKTAWEFLS